MEKRIGSIIVASFMAFMACGDDSRPDGVPSGDGNDPSSESQSMAGNGSGGSGDESSLSGGSGGTGGAGAGGQGGGEADESIIIANAPDPLAPAQCEVPAPSDMTCCQCYFCAAFGASNWTCLSPSDPQCPDKPPTCGEPCGSQPFQNYGNCNYCVGGEPTRISCFQWGADMQFKWAPAFTGGSCIGPNAPVEISCST